MIVYALVTARSDLAVDLYLTREAAEADLHDALEDVPDWQDTLRVVAVETGLAQTGPWWRLRAL